MVQRDLQFPYHQSRGHDGLDGIVACHKETQRYYDELFDLTQFRKVKIQDPHADWPRAQQRTMEFIRDRV